MGRGKSTFRQRDLTAAMKAARDAGIPVARFEVGPDGKIVVVVAAEGDSHGKPTSGANIVL